MLAVEGYVSHVLCISPGLLYGTGGAEAKMASVGDDGEVTAPGTLVDGVAKIDASTQDAFLNLIEAEITDLALAGGGSRVIKLNDIAVVGCKDIFDAVFALGRVAGIEGHGRAGKTIWNIAIGQSHVRLPFQIFYQQGCRMERKRRGR